MKSILITGGSGFIGTNLIDLLQTSSDAKIINFDKAPPIKSAQASCWVKGNIMDEKRLTEIFKLYQPDIVIHLAARTDTLSDVLEDYEENHRGTQHLLNVINSFTCVKHTIIASTQYVYKSDNKPLPTEMDEFSPHTVYGQSKVLTEQYTRAAGLGCMWTIVRPTNIWGPWHMRYPNELWKVIDKGMYYHPVKHEVLRTYGYVKNIVHQIYQILQSKPEIVDKKIFYIGDEPIDSYIWLNELSQQLTNKKIKRLPRFIFQGLALSGDILRAIKIPFPLYSKRFNNMVEDYPAPTELTIKLFGQADASLSNNVQETLLWLNTDGKQLFEYWRNK